MPDDGQFAHTIKVHTSELVPNQGFARVVQLVDYLCSLISDKHAASHVLKLASTFTSLSEENQARELPRTYLLLEKYLTEDDPAVKFTKAGLRNLILRKFVSSLELPVFALIFKPPAGQECLLCKQMLFYCLRSAMEVIDKDGVLINATVWLKSVPGRDVQPLPFGLKRQSPRSYDTHNTEEWVTLLVTVSVELWKHLVRQIGVAEAQRIFLESYGLLRHYFALLETFPVVVRLLPVEIMEKEHIQLLGQQHVESMLIDNINRLETTTEQLSSKNRTLLGKLIREQTQRHHVESELRTSLERYELAARGTNDGIWDWDIARGKLYLSPRWKTMLGYDAEEFGTDPAEWFKMVHSEDLDKIKTRLKQHLDKKTEQFICDYRIKQKDGRYRWMLTTGMAMFDADGKPSRMAGSQTDISESKRSEVELQTEALIDALTSLPNRAVFMRKLNKAFNYAQRQPGFKFAVMFLDMDRFKMINDSLGHLVGDELLKGVAERLISCVRPHDTASRMGGDEFTILLERIGSVDDATEVAERIHKELSRPFDLHGHEVFTNVSTGITIYDQQYQRPEDMIRDADTAMYRAKSDGRAKYKVFQPSMHAMVADKLQLETDLRRALERRQFRIHYQPIIDLKTGVVKSAEALARWEHPVRGLLQPIEFIPLAEETGLIIDLERWLIHEACWNASQWKRESAPQGAPSVSVNLSAKQFILKDLADYVEMVLDDNDLEPTDLKLEITESLFIENSDSAMQLLTQLKKLKVPLSMDDFGTGYSSLSYLYRFPIDTIKIDRAFVHKIADNKKHEEIIKSIIMLARNMDKDVVAEGIETEAQLDILRELGCDYGQGFYFAQPMDLDSFNQFMIDFSPGSNIQELPVLEVVVDDRKIV